VGHAVDVKGVVSVTGDQGFELFMGLFGTIPPCPPEPRADPVHVNVDRHNVST